MSTQTETGRAILLTGASGFLAGDLLPRLMDAYRDTTIYLLLRADTRIELAERRHSVLKRAGLDAAASERVVAIIGDVERSDLGLGANYEKLAGKITEIYHSAANTRFDQSLEKARQVNFIGTENIHNFAGHAKLIGNFQRLHHISTAYIAGAREGIIKEDELDCGQSFFNTYEQSKYESEMMLNRSDLPVSIYRPTIIAGDSRNGCTPHFYVIYEPMKWVYTGQLTFLPCRPETTLDIVPIDYVCDAIVTIGRRSDSIGHTYHLCSGPERGINMKDMVALCTAEFNKYNTEIGKPLVAPPEILTPEMIEKFEGEMRKNSEVFFQRAWQQMQRHMPYAITEKIFDDSKAQTILAESGIKCPSFKEYLPIVVRYALEKQFRV